MTIQEQYDAAEDKALFVAEHFDYLIHVQKGFQDGDLCALGTRAKQIMRGTYLECLTWIKDFNRREFTVIIIGSFIYLLSDVGNDG